MTALCSFSQFYQTVTMETMTIKKNFAFSFDYVFQSRIVTLQSFFTIKWQERKLSIIKIFKFFVSERLKGQVRSKNKLRSNERA